MLPTAEPDCPAHCTPRCYRAMRSLNSIARSLVLMLSTSLLVCLIAPSPGLAEIEKTAIPGPDGLRLYWWPKLPPIQGWHQDHEYSRHYSANALAPDGRTFADAETVIYATALYKPREPDTTSIEVLIEHDCKRFAGDGNGIEISEVGILATADGKRLRSFTFFPKTNGNWERVTYGEEGDYYLIFAISSRSFAGYKAALPAYEYLISRYKEAP